MKIRAIIPTAALAIVALVAVACGEGDTIVNSDGSTTTGISVSGTGRATAEPDLVLLQLGVEVERRTVAAAREAAAASQQAIIEALKANGVDEKDIQTVRFSVQPRYDSPNRVRVLSGYNVTPSRSTTRPICAKRRAAPRSRTRRSGPPSSPTPPASSSAGRSRSSRAASRPSPSSASAASSSLAPTRRRRSRPASSTSSSASTSSTRSSRRNCRAPGAAVRIAEIVPQESSHVRTQRPRHPQRD